MHLAVINELNLLGVFIIRILVTSTDEKNTFIILSKTFPPKVDEKGTLAAMLVLTAPDITLAGCTRIFKRICYLGEES